MPLLATWHPTYALFRAPHEWGVFQEDLAKFSRMVNGTTESSPRITINPTAAQVGELISSGETIAVDIETAPDHRSEPWTGKDPYRAKLKCIGLATTKWGMCLWHKEGPAWEAVKKLLADRSITKVWHNGFLFDLPVLRRLGLEIRNNEDTRDLRRALVSTSPLRLRYLGSLYTDLHAWKDKDEGDDKGIVFTQDKSKLMTYCALDCVVTARAFNKMLDEMGQDPRILALYKHQKSLSQIAQRMRHVGIGYDARQKSFLEWGLTQQLEEQKATFLNLVKVPGMRCTPNDVRKLLYKRYETADIHRFSLPDPLDPKCYTEKGQISVDEDSLIKLLLDPGCPPDAKPLIEAYWAAATTAKMLSTFVRSEKISQLIGKDGRYRPSWNNNGAETGRWACGLMTVKDIYRSMYVAAPGNVLVHGDFKQQELVAMAYVAPDAELQRRLKTNVYVEDAKDWFGLPPTITSKKQIKSSIYKRTKNVHLGCQYAAGPETVWSQMLSEDRDVKFSLVRELHAAFKRTYSETVAYWHGEMDAVRECGYSESRIMGRRRYYPREPPITEVANYPIQSTAADVSNLTIIELDEALRKYRISARIRGTCNIVVQHHDAFDLDVPEKSMEDAKSILQECMERPRKIYGQDVVFKADIMAAPRWNEVDLESVTKYPVKGYEP